MFEGVSVTVGVAVAVAVKVIVTSLLYEEKLLCQHYFRRPI